MRQRVGRDFANWTIEFAQAAAERLGLNAVDLRYLEVVARMGPLTAGQLAELTGLTTGAITGVVDRLERAGYVLREQDVRDRRRVIVGVVFDRLAEIQQVFASSQRAWAELCSHYSDEQLELVLEFMGRSTAVLQEEIDKLRAQRPPARGPGGSPAAGHW